MQLAVTAQIKAQTIKALAVLGECNLRLFCHLIGSSVQCCITSRAGGEGSMRTLGASIGPCQSCPPYVFAALYMRALQHASSPQITMQGYPNDLDCPWLNPRFAAFLKHNLGVTPKLASARKQTAAL